MNVIEILQQEFNIKKSYLENIINLIDDGNTIPFIARYRKEMTGALDDQVLREIFDRLNYIRNLEEKKENIKKLIDEQQLLTEEIILAIDNAKTITEVDDIYRPFRPKRRTRATIAKELGLEDLSNIILEQNECDNIEEIATNFVNENVKTIEEAINGAKDIIAEIISDNAEYRAIIRKEYFKKGIIVTKATKDEPSVYDMYYDFSEPVNKIAEHRILAINRGEKEGFLNVKIEEPFEDIIKILQSKILKNNSKYIIETIEDSYKRLVAPSIEREVRNYLTEKSEEGAIKVFGKNLKQLLMQPPIKDKVVLAIDPGFRTGCKIAIIDGIGKVLKTGVIYVTTGSESKIDEAKKLLTQYIKKFGVEIIAIGNGTASRESELFVVDLIKEIDSPLSYIIVNEAGASVYSASKLGADEFPDYDVALRSAISIGRRLQDSLAELVKIEPKSIGVGQYQHDINQNRLSKMLEGVVESCVNNVGVDLNTASASLLSYISGISSTVAKNIIKYREENGKFKNRKELLKVSKLGPKAFLQCAGFLRITDGDEILDNTSVHPESYQIANILIEKLDIDINKKSNKINGNIDISKLSKELNVGEPTLIDIIKEIEKPGRDPRQEMPMPILRCDVLTMEDLQEGMILKGTVRNVIDFGAFVDIGVHQDGLVHISEMTDKFIKHPLEVVSVSDIVDVKVLLVDTNKNRISLTMKI
ncbi:Tex family protein [[Clostridium] colinum]|uniref:Tex family protein n=1 Tax=[Clostridium] colinum TaxID=36835 RepID=UPI0020250745|nr:Tex family protein [[Clostridium] colinum]